MRRYLLILLLSAPLACFMQMHAQVMMNTDYSQELKQAVSLLAGTSATDIAHHVHYDLKLYDRDGRISTATYDIYRAPLLYKRVDVKADNFSRTHITSERDHKEWLSFSGNSPLRIFDFEQIVERPLAAIGRLSQHAENMQHEQLEGAPLLCANDNDGTSICFNPLIHLISYAQMFNQTVMYDQWLPIGAHTVPGSIRIFQGKKLLVEATGTVEPVEKFPPGLMQIPDTPSQVDPMTAHKVLHSKPIDMTEAAYGNTAIALSVDEKGHVTKADVID